jgi:hypothetical protein
VEYDPPPTGDDAPPDRYGATGAFGGPANGPARSGRRVSRYVAERRRRARIRRRRLLLVLLVLGLALIVFFAIELTTRDGSGDQGADDVRYGYNDEHTVLFALEHPAVVQVVSGR